MIGADSHVLTIEGKATIDCLYLHVSIGTMEDSFMLDLRNSWSFAMPKRLEIGGSETRFVVSRNDWDGG